MTCNKNLNVINVMYKRNIFFCANKEISYPT